MTERDRIANALLALRVGVFIVMFMWTLDKLVNVRHAAGSEAHFVRWRADSAYNLHSLFVSSVARFLQQSSVFCRVADAGCVFRPLSTA